MLRWVCWATAITRLCLVVLLRLRVSVVGDMVAGEFGVGWNSCLRLWVCIVSFCLMLVSLFACLLRVGVDLRGFLMLFGVVFVCFVAAGCLFACGYEVSMYVVGYCLRWMVNSVDFRSSFCLFLKCVWYLIVLVVFAFDVYVVRLVVIAYYVLLYIVGADLCCVDLLVGALWWALICLLIYCLHGV